MDAERAEDVTDWDAEPFDGGFAGLRALADRDFSGAVEGTGGRLFMLNGRVVGVADGDLDDFADASGTAYEAPHPSLALLYAMQARGGELKTKYYTEDTPIAEADETLRSGGFTGYVRLSENVLSGDYYLTYYGGESMCVAFVGSARRLKTGDEAFELADDEVGIYEVYEVDLDVRGVPGAGGSAGATDGAAGTAGGMMGSTTDAAPEPEPDDDPDPADPAGGVSIGGDTSATGTGSGVDSESDSDLDSVPGPRQGPDQSSTPDSGATDDAVPPEIDIDLSPDSGNDDGSDAGPGGAAPGPAAGPLDPDPELDSDPDPDPSPEPDEDAIPAAHDDDSEREPDPASDPAGDDAAEHGATAPTGGDGTGARPDDPGVGTTDPTGGGSTGGPDAGGTAGSDPDAFSREEEWRETAAIPALDPEESGTDPSGDPPADGDVAAVESESDSRDGVGAGPDPDSDPNPAAGSAADRERARESAADRPAVQQNELQRRVARLEEALSETEERRQALEAERDELAAERDRAQERAGELESRVEELQAEVERLEGKLGEARARLPDGEQSMSPDEALSGTNLFVRYDSQGGPTLERAHDGDVDREAVDANLRLEHHTAFDESEVAVDGRPYREFLHDSIQYGFAEWVVTELLYEIRDTGNRAGLRELYDAIPAIDRAEIDGEVSIRRREGGEEHREQRAFDLVLRDRMGNPLFVADLNASREPTAEGSLESLVGHGRDVAESSDSFVGAFAVTASYFQPGALETAADATGGGLLSRGKQKSYVKLSRKRGFHLCLVETRGGEFHLNVPEL